MSIKEIADKDFEQFIHNDAIYYVGYMFQQLKRMGIDTDNLLTSKNNKQIYIRKLLNKIISKVLRILDIILNYHVKEFDNKGRKITKNEFIGRLVSYLSIFRYLATSIHFNDKEETAFQNLSVDCIYDLKNKYQQKSLRSDIYEFYKVMKS